MADISNVNVHEIKDLYESLEGLSCESSRIAISISVLTLRSSHHDSGPILGHPSRSSSFFGYFALEGVKGSCNTRTASTLNTD